MNLPETGRNDPCHCGSGKKYKKCCLGAADAVVLATAPGEADVVALVEAADRTNDWAAVRSVFDVGFAFFQAGQPFEHVRFRTDTTNTALADTQQRTHLAGEGWLRWCEREVVRALGEYQLRPEQRSGLRMIVHLVRRFGAKSPLVHELTMLQASERANRERRFGDLVEKLGFTIEEVGKHVSGLPDWLEQTRPSILSFPDWFALQLALPAQVEELWRSGIAARVCDANLNYLEQPAPQNAIRHLQLVGIGLAAAFSSVGVAIAAHTDPRTTSEDEKQVVASIRNDTAPPAEAAPRILQALVARSDFAGAAIFRATLADIANRLRT
jgi:hypothetical protein